MIPAGVVDDRSITEVEPDELKRYTQCHFFAGIAGWSYALKLAGWLPTRPIWTGSCPCQPFSNAGQRKGTEDARHLWPVWFDLIRECRPPVIMGEQVAAAVGKNWLDGVYLDMEGEGYTVESTVLPACAVGAAHRRDRLWFVAHAHSGRDRAGDTRPDIGAISGSHESDHAGRRPLVHAASEQFERHPAGTLPMDGERKADRQPDGEAGSVVHRPTSQGHCGIVADSELHRCDGQGIPDEQGKGDSVSSRTHQSGEIAGVVLADPARIGFGQECQDTGGSLEGGRARAESGPSSPDRVLMGNAGSARGETWLSAQARRSEGDAEILDDGGGRRFGPWGECVWIIGADGKARRVEPRICLLAHGVPARVAKLRAFGNAIVPQVAAEVIGAFMDCHYPDC